VDRDLGFVFWLGRALHGAGYQALPAKSIGDATTLLGQLNLAIDLLIVDPSLDGARGFAHALHRFQGNLKVIAVVDEREEPSSAFPGADASERRPVNPDDTSRTRWLGTIRLVFESPGRNPISATAR
jgi:hypothetical protein